MDDTLYIHMELLRTQDDFDDEVDEVAMTPIFSESVRRGVLSSLNGSKKGHEAFSQCGLWRETFADRLVHRWLTTNRPRSWLLEEYSDNSRGVTVYRARLAELGYRTVDKAPYQESSPSQSLSGH